MGPLEELQGLRHSELCRFPNKYQIPVTVYPLDEQGVASFNRFYRYLNKNLPHRFDLTARGSIPTDKDFMYSGEKWTDFSFGGGHEIIVCLNTGWYRIQCRGATSQSRNGAPVLYGHKAFQIFRDACLEHNIRLEDYAVDNGADIKKKIKPPHIEILYQKGIDKTINPCYHLDIHSAYAGGVLKDFPEFKPVYTQLYMQRQSDDAIYKQVINCSIGYMQSEICGYRYAMLSKAAVNNTRLQVENMIDSLRMTGRTPLLSNTDGIWYTGPRFELPQGEGTWLGQWHHDECAVTFRMKSPGAYEFLRGDGTYQPRLRGRTMLDGYKNREDWEWGDIYRTDAVVIKYKFEEGKGVVKIE